MFLCRRSQVGKATDCNSVMRRFESYRRLYAIYIAFIYIEQTKYASLQKRALKWSFKSIWEFRAYSITERKPRGVGGDKASSPI